MVAETSEARKRREAALFGEPQWAPSEADLRESRALAALQRVYPSADRQEASALLDALEDEGLVS